MYAGNLNPLQGRRAFVGTSAGYPAFNTATVNLGTAYAGQTVQIRFRIGTDNAVAPRAGCWTTCPSPASPTLPFSGSARETGLCGEHRVRWPTRART